MHLRQAIVILGHVKRLYLPCFLDAKKQKNQVSDEKFGIRAIIGEMSRSKSGKRTGRHFQRHFSRTDHLVCGPFAF